MAVTTLGCPDMLPDKYPQLQLGGLDQIWCTELLPRVRLGVHMIGWWDRWPVPPELSYELAKGTDMFETFQAHKKRFKEYDKRIMITAARMDNLLARLNQCGEECIVIVAHQITINELTKRLQLCDPDEMPARRLKLLTAQYTKTLGARKAEAWISEFEKCGEGCWLDNCEVRAHKIEWGDVTLA